MFILTNHIKSKGFTLIELLVVIAIIGILSSIVIISMKGIRSKAKIVKSIQFSKSINHALGVDAVGIWDFNDNETSDTALDRSGYANHGTITGATYVGGPSSEEDDTPYHVLGQGERQYALSFDGSDYVDCGSHSSLDITDAITIEAWMKVPDISGNTYAIYKDTGTRCWAVKIEGSRIRFIVWDSNGILKQVYSNVGVISNNTWFHIAAIRDGSAPIHKIYINSVLQTDTNDWAGSMKEGDNIPVKMGGKSSYFFNGTIDEVRIYEQALSLGQIQQRYAESAPSHGITLR